LVPRRRRIALENLRPVFAQTKTEQEIREIARKACGSLIASWFETVNFVSLLRTPERSRPLRQIEEGLDLHYQKAREIHRQSGGCIFVTPHMGNWELLPYVGLSAGISAVVVVRPLDNKYLEKWLARYREASGQIIVAKTNSMQFLQMSLRRGKSIAMLPDQSTMKAISVEYLGRQATTTPIPAILAVRYNRPIVVVACWRKCGVFRYEGFVGDPIWPQPQLGEKVEIFRLTEAMNREMGAIVQRHPEQYLWMHDRWKRYSRKNEMVLN